MAATTPIQDGFQTFIAGLTTAQAQQLLTIIFPQLQQSLQPPQQNAGSQAPNAASSMRTTTGLTNVRTGKKYRNKKTKSASATGGPKRPLNSWMAFRKYYNGSLSPHTQKAISKVLKEFWREDPFEAKWTMLAKAYSIVRGDRNKEDAPLDDFMVLCTSRIGVIPPEQYQRAMGWNISPPNRVTNKEVEIVRVFIPDVNAFPEHIKNTSLSVDDLVAHCRMMGFGRPTRGDNNGAHSGALTMAVQPTTLLAAANPQASATAVNADTTNEADGTNALNNAGPCDPLEIELRARLQEDIRKLSAPAPAPVGEITLNNAAVSISAMANPDATVPYAEFFDPTSNFDLSFNPVGEYTAPEALAYGSNRDHNDGAFDAFNATAAGGETYFGPPGGFNMSDYVHDDMSY